jgi:hypothetical protein
VAPVLLPLGCDHVRLLADALRRNASLCILVLNGCVILACCSQMLTLAVSCETTRGVCAVLTDDEQCTLLTRALHGWCSQR